MNNALNNGKWHRHHQYGKRPLKTAYTFALTKVLCFKGKAKCQVVFFLSNDSGLLTKAQCVASLCKRLYILPSTKLYQQLHVQPVVVQYVAQFCCCCCCCCCWCGCLSSNCKFFNCLKLCPVKVTFECILVHYASHVV